MGLKLGQPCLHRVQEGVLGILFGGAVLAGVNIGAHHRQRFPVDVEVSLDPATRLVERFWAEIVL